MASAAGSLRVSRTERERAVESLKAAFADGRIDGQELDQRLPVAMGARTRDDLDSVMFDLRAAAPANPMPSMVHTRQPSLAARVCNAVSNALCCGSQRT